MRKTMKLDKFISKLIDEIEYQRDIVIGEFSIDFDKDRAALANEIEALRLEAERLLSDRG